MDDGELKTGDLVRYKGETSPTAIGVVVREVYSYVFVLWGSGKIFSIRRRSLERLS